VLSNTLESQFKSNHGQGTLPIVLVSAGIELIFFLVVGIVLCFGFGVKIMLITQGCFSCC